MNHPLYSLAVILLLPWAALHLLWRARRQPEYLHHWGERFGLIGAVPPAPTLWIHAVSVGETRAAQPLVAALKAAFPDHRLLLTHMTPTGRATSEALYGDSVERVYLPYDTSWAVRRFLCRWQPRIGLIMETELWPNLIAAARRQDIPMLLVNARLSARSAGRYARLAPLARESLGALAAVGAQSAADAERLRQLGALNVEVTGSLKFDIAPPPDHLELATRLRALWGARPVWLAASTREGEEALILDAWARVGAGSTALLVIVPRHPQRFDDVAALATKHFTVQRRSENTPVAPDTGVLIGDSMGEMFAYYAAADLAFVGGSLLDFGSQNLIEACSVGTPVLIGPSTFNFAEAAKEALSAGAAKQVANADGLVREVLHLLGDAAARERMGTAGRDFAARHQGATARTMALVTRAMR